MLPFCQYKIYIVLYVNGEHQSFKSNSSGILSLASAFPLTDTKDTYILF